MRRARPGPRGALINNPDAYIHSSDDDLQNIDATQLKRNAFIVAAAAFLASAGDEDVPMITGEVFSQGGEAARVRLEDGHRPRPGERRRRRGAFVR